MGIERKVTGLENLVTQVEEAKSALKLLELQIERIEIRSGDHAGIESAIREAEGLIDEKTAQFGNNAIAMTLVRDFRIRMRDLLRRRGGER